MEVYVIVLSYLMLGLLEIEESQYDLNIFHRFINPELASSFFYVLIAISYLFMHFSVHDKMTKVYGIPVIVYYILCVILLIGCYLVFVKTHKKRIQKRNNKNNNNYIN